MTTTPPPAQELFDEGHLFQTVHPFVALVVFLHLLASLLFAPSWWPVYTDVAMLVFVGALKLYVGQDAQKLPDVYVVLVISQMAGLVLWFGMGGLKGPGLALNLATVVLYLLIDASKERHWPIAGLMVLFTGVALALEYQYPDWVPTHEDATKQTLYTMSTFLCLLLLVVPTMRYAIQQIITAQRQRLQLEAEHQATDERQRFLVALKELQEYVFLGEYTAESFQSLLQLLLDYTESTYGLFVAIEEETTLQPLALLHEGKALDPQALLQPAYWGVGLEDPLPLMAWQAQVTENPPTVLRIKGPKDQPNLGDLCCFPIYHEQQLLGLVGMAKDQTYPNFAQEDLTLFLSTYTTILYHRQLQQKQQRHQTDLATAKEATERSSQAQKQFFTNISHELRTPLSLVVGPISALLGTDQDPSLSASTRASLDMVLRNSKKMLQYVNDIMDLSKISDNSLELHRRPCHLHSLVQGIYQAFEVQTHYRSVKFELRYEANRDLVAALDAEKLEKIINNLLSNAFKYTPDGGVVVLKVEERPQTLYWSVEDTGTGIAPEDLPHVFDRFYQTATASKLAVAGTGVGLALAQELTQLHGGRIAVESELEKGAHFFFELPLERSTIPEVTAPSTATEHDPNKDSILIVEDNRDMAGFIQLVLQKTYNITVAYNGVQGWKALQERPNYYQLLITDLMMPEMDGFELLERLKATEWGRSLPTVVLTARADAASKLKALTIGIDEYLTKPFSVEELTLHVRNLMQNAAARQAAAAEAPTEAEGTTDTEAAPETPRLTPVQREKINRARTIVLENIDEPDFGVEVLARSLATSKRQLYRFMQLHTGLTPLKFINEIRLQEARRMLEQGLCSTVKEVSYSIGFLSTRHFSKTYANRFGKKPSEYFR